MRDKAIHSLTLSLLSAWDADFTEETVQRWGCSKDRSVFVLVDSIESFYSEVVPRVLLFAFPRPLRQITRTGETWPAIGMRTHDLRANGEIEVCDQRSELPPLGKLEEAVRRFLENSQIMYVQDFEGPDGGQLDGE